MGQHNGIHLGHTCTLSPLIQPEARKCGNGSCRITHRLPDEAIWQLWREERKFLPSADKGQWRVIMDADERHQFQYDLQQQHDQTYVEQSPSVTILVASCCESSSSRICVVQLSHLCRQARFSNLRFSPLGEARKFTCQFPSSSSATKPRTQYVQAQCKQPACITSALR